MLPEITEKVGATRALSVPYPLGYPFGQPQEPELQRRILGELLRLCTVEQVPARAEFLP